MTRGYIELSTERQRVVMVRSGKDGGVGSFSIPGPVPWSAMLRWCRWHRLDRDTTNHAIAALGAVDSRVRKKALDAARARTG